MQISSGLNFGLPRLRHHARKLAGQRVTAIETRGKAMLTHFDHGYSIYSHNQLYGKWMVQPAGVMPATGRMHQIRRHMRHLRHPIVNDRQYGDNKHNRFFTDELGCRRLLLAATELVAEVRALVEGRITRLFRPPPELPI